MALRYIAGTGVGRVDSPHFACDAMLGGLTRWLRAAGYEATWYPGINDSELVRIAQREGSILLTSDTGIFHHSVVRDHHTLALFIPHGLTVPEQLLFVLRELHLKPREPRCMSCGGRLITVAKDEVQDKVPPRSFAWKKEFWRCERCDRVLWRGTHWTRIEKVLKELGDRQQTAQG